MLIFFSFQLDFGGCGLTFTKVMLEGWADPSTPTILDRAYKCSSLEVINLLGYVR
jgi:hypothetical protein